MLGEGVRPARVTSPTCRSQVRKRSEQTRAKSRAGLATIVSRCQPGPAGSFWMIRPDRGDDLSGGQVDAHRVMPGLLVPGLVPGDERRALPALVVVMGQDRIPVQQVRDAAMIPPAAPLVGQLDREIEHRLGRLSRRQRRRQGDDHDRVGSFGSNSKRAGRPATATAGISIRRPSAVHRLLGTEPEHLQRLGQDEAVGIGHLVPRVNVENQDVRGGFRAIGEDDPLAGGHEPGGRVDAHVEAIARQPRRHHQPRPLFPRPTSGAKPFERAGVRPLQGEKQHGQETGACGHGRENLPGSEGRLILPQSPGVSKLNRAARLLSWCGPRARAERGGQRTLRVLRPPIGRKEPRKNIVSHFSPVGQPPSGRRRTDSRGRLVRHSGSRIRRFDQHIFFAVPKSVPEVAVR